MNTVEIAPENMIPGEMYLIQSKYYKPNQITFNSAGEMIVLVENPIFTGRFIKSTAKARLGDVEALNTLVREELLEIAGYDLREKYEEGGFEPDEYIENYDERNKHYLDFIHSQLFEAEVDEDGYSDEDYTMPEDKFLFEEADEHLVENPVLVGNWMTAEEFKFFEIPVFRNALDN